MPDSMAFGKFPPTWALNDELDLGGAHKAAPGYAFSQPENPCYATGLVQEVWLGLLFLP